ncbi:unnamed protein product, partial [Protopolystoma xenopodis]
MAERGQMKRNSEGNANWDGNNSAKVCKIGGVDRERCGEARWEGGSVTAITTGAGRDVAIVEHKWGHLMHCGSASKMALSTCETTTKSVWRKLKQAVATRQSHNLPSQQVTTRS